jgi:hypothetical protein
MSTKITVSYKKSDYTLEFSRTTAAQIEEQGFILDQISEKPNKMIPLLVYGAFLKHNRGIKRNLVDEIYKNLVGKAGDDETQGFIATLAEMYAETVETLTDTKNVDEGNKAVWSVSKV